MSRNLEERVAKLEQEVDLLKSRKPTDEPKDWISLMSGAFANEPEFEEVVRLGREYREADRPRDEAP